MAHSKRVTGELGTALLAQVWAAAVLGGPQPPTCPVKHWASGGLMWVWGRQPPELALFLYQARELTFPWRAEADPGMLAANNPPSVLRFAKPPVSSHLQLCQQPCPGRWPSGKFFSFYREEMGGSTTGLTPQLNAGVGVGIGRWERRSMQSRVGLLNTYTPSQP